MGFKEDTLGSQEWRGDLLCLPSVSARVTGWGRGGWFLGTNKRKGFPDYPSRHLLG